MGQWEVRDCRYNTGNGSGTPSATLPSGFVVAGNIIGLYRMSLAKYPPLADEHECGVCGETFDSEEELKEHAREEHDREMD